MKQPREKPPETSCGSVFKAPHVQKPRHFYGEGRIQSTTRVWEKRNITEHLDKKNKHLVNTVEMEKKWKKTSTAQLHTLLTVMIFTELLRRSLNLVTIETCLFMQRADMAWESAVHDSPASPAKVSLL